MSAMYKLTMKIKKSKNAKVVFEPMTMCMPERCLIHCTDSIVVRESIVTGYDNCFTWRLVMYVSQQHPLLQP